MPVLAGLPWLAASIGGLFTSLFTWLAGFISRKIAVTVLGVSVMFTLTYALITALEFLVSGISTVVPGAVVQAMGLLMPSNYMACVGVALSGRFLLFLYQWKIKVLEYKMLAP